MKKRRHEPRILLSPRHHHTVTAVSLYPNQVEKLNRLVDAWEREHGSRASRSHFIRLALDAYPEPK